MFFFSSLPSKTFPSILFMLSLFSFSWACFLSLKSKVILLSWDIISFHSSQISIPLILDPSGLLFGSVVLFISANVLLFSSFYMIEDPSLPRFTHLVILFVVSMNLLIFIPNLISLLIGWDGLGLVSFILVIYYQNPKSLAAGIITALTNRIGDVLILLSIALCVNQGHWMIMNTNPSNLTLAFLLSIAACTKSAQIPFSSWLPAAMAAPTPVSALVHSSTLVTAGVFLVFRFFNLISSHPMVLKSLLLMGATTMFMAGTVAMFETDMKKIIALSTLSQLGVMMFSLGANLPNLAFFHLLTHALFKALLFICAGTLIHIHNHSQDLRYMGNIFSQLPSFLASMWIANMALCGLPFMAGFYSKDLIIESSSWGGLNLLTWFLLSLATLLTAAYSTRFSMIVFFNPSSSLPSIDMLKKMNNLLLSTSNLTWGAIVGGALINWIILPPLTHPSVTFWDKMMALMLTSMGIVWALKSFSHKPSKMIKSMKMNWFLSSMWLLTPITTQSNLNLFLPISLKFLTNLDQGWFELGGPKGLEKSVSLLSSTNSGIQLNLINSQMIISLALFSPAILL